MMNSKIKPKNNRTEEIWTETKHEQKTNKKKMDRKKDGKKLK